MRKPSIGLIAATLLMISLAGCASPEPTTSDGATPTPTPTQTPTPSPTPTGTPGKTPTPSEQPKAWEPKLSAEEVAGTAPFDVTFKLDSSTKLTGASWTLDLGDGNDTQGTTLPATFTHAYGAGDHTATFALTHEGTTKTATLDLAIEAAPVLPEPIVDEYTAKVLIGAPWLLWDETGEVPQMRMDSVAWASYDNELPNQDGHAFTVAPGTLSLEIVSAKLAGEVHDPSGEICGPDDALEYDTDMFLYTADGTLVAKSGSCGTDEHIRLEAPAAGNYVLVQFGYAGANMEIATTITMQPDYV